ncbi:MAG: alkaline phosphatase [bacterium]
MKFYVKRLSVALLMLIFLFSLQSTAISAVPRVKYVIVMIADGAGMAHLGAAHYFNRLLLDEEFTITEKLFNKGKLGIVTTYALNSLVPDSAASGTAIATGKKTNNNMISMLPDGTPVKTVMERAIELGYKTGLIAKSTITDATPAVFASHVTHRSLQDQIAVQYLEKRIDVILGGGKAYWISASSPASSRKDERDLILEAKNLGYNIVSNLSELEGVKSGKVLGLFSSGNMPFRLDADPTVIPSLKEMTEKAIELLYENSKGFFLMVEGSRVDHASHNNDIASVIAELREFDEAVRVALDFYNKHPRETLLIVTTDHDNGGLSITSGYDTSGKGRYPTVEDLNRIFLVPFSFERAKSVVEKEGVEKLFNEHYTGELRIPQEWMERLTSNKPITPTLNSPFYASLGAGFSAVYMTAWATNDHTATPVWVVSLGPGSYRLSGFIDQTEIGKTIFRMLGEIR